MDGGALAHCRVDVAEGNWVLVIEVIDDDMPTSQCTVRGGCLKVEGQL